MQSVTKSLFLAALVGLCGVSQATTLSFEDISSSSPSAVNYGGLTWDSHWVAYNTAQPPYNASSGSMRIYTHNYGGWIKFGDDVTFLGSWVASADVGQSMWWEGYDDGSLVYTSNKLYGGVQQWVNVNWAGVDEVRFVCTSFNYFIIDDLSYTVGGRVPETGTTVALLGLALTAIGFLRRRLV